MPNQMHLLVVRVGDTPWALPMDSVEQTIDLATISSHQVGRSRLAVYRGKALNVHRFAELIGAASSQEPAAGVVVWAGGRRHIFAVDSLVGQLELEVLEVPELARPRACSGIAHLDGEIVPVVQPGVAIGAWSLGGDTSFGLSALQSSALVEIANIGSSHAATALSQLLGRAVEIQFSAAIIASLAEAADRIGSQAASSVLIDTPVAGDDGKVLLLFPDGSAEGLCRLLGLSLADEMGRSALREVGNILASSYLNAIVQMTGLDFEPEPPTIEIDVLGSLLERTIGGPTDLSEPTVLMRSVLTVELTDASFAFLFVPKVGSVRAILEGLGVGSPAATAG